MLESTSPLARVALRGDFPRELAQLLLSLRIDPFGVGGLDADFVAALERQKEGGWMLKLRSPSGASATGQAIFCANAFVASSLLLSQALQLGAPFLVASDPTCAIVRKGIELARTPVNILIEGETGTGKRSLTELIERASGNRGGFVAVDCAAAVEVKRFIDAGRLSSAAPKRIVILDHLAELPRATQEALAEVMGLRLMRFFATSRLSVKPMVSRGAFAPVLLEQFDATLELVPLNRRRSDREALAEYFLRCANPLLKLDSSALTALRHYRFPGNVRELKNMMVSVAVCRGDESPSLVDRTQIEEQFARATLLANHRSADHEKADSQAGPRLRLISSSDGVRPRRRLDSLRVASLKLVEGRS